MKISTQSWHYRLLFHFDMDRPQNLCSYFWKVVGAICFGLFLFAMAILCALCALTPVYTASLWTITGLFPSSDWILAPFLVIGSSVYFIFGLLVSYQYMKAAIAKIDQKEKKHHKPNILVEYAKAVKNRVCPLIEYE